MTQSARLAAVLALAVLAACGSSSTSESAVFGEPSSVAVFRGVTVKSGRDDTSAVYPYRPYIAVANAASNSISVVDAIDDSLVQSPAVSRGLVYSAPGRPVLLAAADLGDRLPDLLVVVTAGDLPWLGGTQLRVVRTWRADGSIVDRADGGPAVDFGADILALQPLPFDPAAPGTATLVAALAGERIATVSFPRRAGSDAIDVDAAQATVRVSAPLGFQPLHLAAIPGERGRVFAATTDPIGAVQGVAQVDVTGTPALTAALDARAPTRLVAAGHLVEGSFAVPALDATPFDSAVAGAAVDRVWAVLDESACGLQAQIACGVVALDPASGTLVPDPTPAGSMHAPFRAPIPIVYPLALGAGGPPSVPPSAAEPQLAGSAMAIAMTSISRVTTGVAGVVASNGIMTFVDLGRWDVASNQLVLPNVKGTVASSRPSGSTGTQWLTLVDPATGSTIVQTDVARLSSSLTVTAGYTPTDHWTVTAEGALPGLSLRRAQPFADGGLALQVTEGGAVHEAVRLWDPTLGVTAGDIVVIEPTGLGTCTTFEASVASLDAPTPARPGGSVTLGQRTPTNPAWNGCLDAMKADAASAAPAASYLATIRAGGFVLLRGAGAAAAHVGRPVPGERFEVRWEDEAPLAAACLLPPAVRWQSTWNASPPACDAGCRDACARLLRARLARRVGYVWESPAGITGPALGFTLGLTAPVGRTVVAPRDVVLTISTADGRAPYLVTPTTGSYVDAHQVLVFDRSPWSSSAGTRFLVPYRSGVVMDSTPSLSSNQTTTIH